MRIFYFDEIMSEQERKQDFIALINYLENIFIDNKLVQILTTLISYSWYCFVEGPCVKGNITGEDLIFFHNKWKYYFELGSKEYLSSPEICYIAGYTYYMDGFLIHETSNNAKLGQELVQRCYNITKDENLKVLAKNFLDNCNKRKYKKIENVEPICDLLFPSDSELDKYFRNAFSYNS